MSRLKVISDEVRVANEPIVQLGRTEIDDLKRSLPGAPRGRIRICAHRDATDSLHEMLVAVSQSSYVRPHKHPGKSESFHMIEGVLDVVVFDDSGVVISVVQLGGLTSGRSIFYRMADPLFHAIILRSDRAVYHETTNGPFRLGDAVYAPWSPPEADVGASRRYLEAMRQSVALFLAAQP
jgi:cupin fold WbuC family metalloprotein